MERLVLLDALESGTELRDSQMVARGIAQRYALDLGWEDAILARSGGRWNV